MRSLLPAAGGRLLDVISGAAQIVDELRFQSPAGVGSPQTRTTLRQTVDVSAGVALLIEVSVAVIGRLFSRRCG
jgi:hypothetical protein